MSEQMPGATVQSVLPGERVQMPGATVQSKARGALGCQWPAGGLDIGRPCGRQGNTINRRDAGGPPLA
ncbi:MAG TPA: hypothetical protein VFT67_02940 [Jatrophihabitantaceae bacterium]|nr:hypothetical protein [Jatrophihabitantaceae bacterium]